MEFQIVNNMDYIRYILGAMICILSIVFIFKRKPKSFQKSLKSELSSKKIKRIEKQALRLKEENNKATDLLKNLEKITGFNGFEQDIPKDDQKYIWQNNLGIVPSKPPIRQLVSSNFEEKDFKIDDPYKRVRQYVEKGIDKEVIEKQTGISAAEIELMLKMQRLQRISRMNGSSESKALAYG